MTNIARKCSVKIMETAVLPVGSILLYIPVYILPAIINKIIEWFDI